MNSITIALYAPWLYTIISYIDYIQNRKEYVCSKYLPGAFDQLIQNIFMWIPASIYILLVFFPSTIAIGRWYIEIGMLAMEFIIGEIWFYIFHRICHHKKFYFIHKKHHEIINPIGMLANYASPIEILFVNSGSFYITHMIFNHSQFHFMAIITIAFANTILYSHTSSIKEQHYIHHQTSKYNFGQSFFMDYIFNTQCKSMKK